MTMIEKARQALEAYWVAEGYDPSEPDEGAVRAVIAALLEPDNAMIEAMEREIGNGLYTDGYESTGFYAAYQHDDPAAPFTAAINAVLAEGRA